MGNLNFSFLFFLKVSCVLLCVLPSKKSIAQKSTDSTHYFYYKILSPNTSEDLANGYIYFKKYVDDKRLIKDTIGLVYGLRMMAIAEYDLGQIYISEQTATEAKKLVESASEDIRFPEQTEIGLNNHLGMVYKNTNQPKKAIQTYSMALAKTKSIKDSLTLLNNLANAYRDNKNYDEAIAILTTVFERNKKLNNLYETARSLDNLGYIQTMLSYPDGLPNMLEALELREKLEDPGPLFTSYNHLSKYYQSIGDTTTARAYALRGKEAAKKVSVGYRQEALKSYYSLSDNPEIVEFVRNSDSISNASLQQDIKFASIAYDFSKEKERTQFAELAREKEQQKKIIYQIIGLFIVLLGTALFFVLKYRHRKEKAEEIYRTESRISKKVHDEVANDLYQVMTKVQTTSFSNDKLLDDLDAVYHKTRDISKDHGLIEVTQDYGELLKDLLLTYRSDQVNVIIKNVPKIDWSALGKTKKIVLYRVLQELMTNMRKHSMATLVVVSVTRTNKTYHIEYVDNGKGGSIIMGNGLRNVENRIQAVKGTIIFETAVKQGCKVKIKL